MVELGRVTLSNDELGGFVGLYFLKLAELPAGDVLALTGLGLLEHRWISFISLGVVAGGHVGRRVIDGSV